MEVYAGYLTYIDHEFGRVVNYLKQINQLDNTLIFVVIGDNGASKEGTYNGVINKGVFGKTLSDKEAIKSNLDSLDEIGTPAGHQTNYPLGWAQACNTPFKYWKQDANSEGGTRNPLIVFYPKGIKDKGTVRNQYAHVIDLLPTTLEFTGIKQPDYIRGIKQDPVQGTSLVYSFNDATAASKHTDQYYYIFGSRSIYKDGWKAETWHHPDYIDENIKPDSGRIALGGKFDNDVWELYNLNEDFNERNDLSKKYPEKLKALQDLYNTEAIKYHIYPFIDWDDVLHRRIHNSNGTNMALVVPGK